MAKTPNYTEEQTAELVEGYIAVSGEPEALRNAYVENMASKFGKSVRSIRAKLSRENVYVAKKPTAKDGSPIVRKDALVAELALQVGLPVDSAINMTKVDIKNVIACIESLRDEIEDLSIEMSTSTED